MELTLRAAAIDWESVDETSYIRGIEALRDTDRIGFHKPVTFFTGENGTGKSTLLEGIAVAAGFNPEGGSKNYSFSTYDSHSELSDAIRLIRNPGKTIRGYFLRAESFYNVATKEEEYAKGPGGVPKDFHKMSHGESFLKVFQDYFWEDGLYLLDEPEAALSPQRQLTLLRELWVCSKTGAQFLIVTHSPILLALPDAEILTFDEGPVHPCRYEDTLSVTITSMFINGKESILHKLLDD
ncbi:MAG: AAA family ATPase [Solobacterium sp.]|nr:AAA family ATPase [Solobacterium sp.]